MMFCEKCDHLYDTDLETECPKCDDIEVAPGIYQSREDYEANHAFDEARDNEL